MSGHQLTCGELRPLYCQHVQNEELVGMAQMGQRPAEELGPESLARVEA